MSAWEGSEWQRQREQAALAPPRGRPAPPETPPAAEPQVEHDEMDHGLDRFVRDQPPPTPEQEAARREQLVQAILKTGGARGRVQLAEALHGAAHKHHEAALRDKKMGQLAEFASFCERIQQQLDGTEDWSTTKCYSSRESFESLTRDLVQARDLLLLFDKKAAQTDAMLTLVHEMIEDGVTPGDAPVVEDRARR